MLTQHYYSIRKDINKLLSFLHDEFPDIDLLYRKIAPHSWLGHHTRKLARWLDHYIVDILHAKYRIHEVWLRDIFEKHYYFEENPMFGMFKTDIVHLNQYGNAALAATVMRPLLYKSSAANK